VTTVLVAIDRLPPSTVLEARQACESLGLTTTDWVSGMVKAAPLAIIGGLDHGVRRIPDDLVALLEATPALRLILCAQEPLVDRRVVIGDGRVSVLGPPVDRTHIGAALRAAILPPAAPSASHSGQRFEVLRRSHWIAWARGRSGPAISLHEQRGATVVIGGASHNRAAIAEVMSSAQVDEDRESALGVLAGTTGVAHLTHTATEWVVYWPLHRCPLWIYSPNRIPARWDAARGIAAVTNRRLVRLSAFPEDQLVAVWSDGAGADDALAPVHHLVEEGGSETIIGLDDITSRNDHITGVVMEVR
jgi:hypothetical protein